MSKEIKNKCPFCETEFLSNKKIIIDLDNFQDECPNCKEELNDKINTIVDAYNQE